MRGLRDGSAVCIGCMHIYRRSDLFYAVLVDECGMWVAGCKGCFDNRAHAKSSVTAHVTSCEGCALETCPKCMDDIKVRHLEFLIRADGYTEGEA